MPERDAGRRFARSAWIYGRVLGVVFLIAFVSLHSQILGLCGEHGIEPAAELLENLRARGFGFAELPTFAWAFGASDFALEAMCLGGELASLALIAGAIPGPAVLIATAFYLSLVHVGGTFLLFQWDSLLVETGFASAFFLPWRLAIGPRSGLEPTLLSRWVLHLVLFRLMFLSGVVKLASQDPTWASLTALEYHYWTQPLPNPLSWPMHQLPSPVHKISCALMFGMEIGAPWAMALGRWGKRGACAALVLLQVMIALTGNYGFFNLLAIALCIPLLDDAAIGRLIGERGRKIVRGARKPSPRRFRLAYLQAPFAAALIVLGLAQIIASLGGTVNEPIISILREAGRYEAVNGYGLFAVMTTERREIRIEGSLDGVEWREYRFRYKPCDPHDLPAQIAPHMPRLDWQMWFAALGDWRDSPWLMRFMRRLIEGQPDVLDLLDGDPFHGQRPRFVRARVSDWRFGDWALMSSDGAYWRTGELEPYSPTVR